MAESLIREAPEGVLLDAGCGPGTVARLLTAASRPALAFDIVARWPPRAPGPPPRGDPLWFRGDVLAMPFADRQFAGVAAGELLEHLDDDCAAVAELARVLTSGGVLVVTVPAGENRFGALDERFGHRRRYSRALLRGALERGGLRIELLRGWGWPFGRAYDRWVQRPALTRSRGRRSWLGDSPLRRLPLEALFAVEALWDSRDAGSGLLAIARKP